MHKKKNSITADDDDDDDDYDDSNNNNDCNSCLLGQEKQSDNITVKLAKSCVSLPIQLLKCSIL